MSHNRSDEPQLTLFIGTILLISTLFALYQRFLKHDPLHGIPGPIFARYTPLWLGYQVRMGRRYLAIHEAHKRYGRVVRISPNHVSVADKDALPIIYGQGSGMFDKSAFYHAFVSGKPSVFSTVDRHDHSQKRRVVSQAFSYQSIQHFCTFMQTSIEAFVAKMDDVCDKKESVDLLTWLNYLAFDILSDLAFGEPIGMVKNGSPMVPVQLEDGTTLQEDAIALVDGREHLAAIVGLHPSFALLSKFIPDPFFKRCRKSSVGLMDLARRCVIKRVRSGSHRDDILGKVIQARLEETPTLGPEQITDMIAESVTLLSAGSDTTSSTITAILYLVLNHPPVYRRLMEELDGALDDHSEFPTHSQLKDLPYLHATIEEGLRYHATVAMGMHRLVPEGGVTCCGTYLPGGTEISVPTYTIQHDETIWGDPETFRPERWLKSNALRPYLVTFGKGPRSCLGKNLAYMEMQLVVATLLHRYNIRLQSESLETTEGFVRKAVRMMVRLGRRTPADYHSPHVLA